jgi:hypothetical protein
LSPVVKALGIGQKMCYSALMADGKIKLLGNGDIYLPDGTYCDPLVAELRTAAAAWRRKGKPHEAALLRRAADRIENLSDGY